MDEQMKTLTVNIERQFFAAIVAGTKRIEYREVKPFWKRRIEPLKPPFKLRLLNGMREPIPEALVMVNRVTRVDGEYRLHLGRILRVQRGDRRAQKPRR